jgi:hypothetical protein
MCERKAVGFLYRYLEFIAGEDPYQSKSCTSPAYQRLPSIHSVVLIYILHYQPAGRSRSRIEWTLLHNFVVFLVRESHIVAAAVRAIPVRRSAIVHVQVERRVRRL